MSLIRVTHMCAFWLLLAVCLHAAVPPAESAKGSPPQLFDRFQSKFRIPVGTALFKLTCPVLAKDDKTHLLMIEWRKSGELIDSDSPRIKISKNQRELRIKNIKLEDSGVYECQATNGYGHRTVQMTVHVHNPDSDGLSLKDSIVQTSEDSPPEWLNNADMETSSVLPIKIQEGGKMELRCPAKGKPLPEIRWYKDNILLQQNSEPYSALLVIDVVKETDTADYRCVVENNLGSIENTYRVRINPSEEKDQAPVIDQFNSSVKEGHTAQLTCKAKAQSTPLIKWLKQIDDSESIKKVDPNATVISLYGMYLLVLDQPQDVVESVRRGDSESTYTNRLIIPSVRKDHEGKYVCVVTSALGNMVYKTAQLDVIEDFKMDALSFSSDMLWYVILPVALLFVALVIWAIYYLKSNQEDVNPKNVSNKPPPPPRIPPPMAPSQGSDTIYPQSGYPSDTHYVVEKASHSPLMLQDHMFQTQGYPVSVATLDKKHINRLHRGVRENDMNTMNTYDRSPPQPYWNHANNHPIYAPPSGHYRTLEPGFPYRHHNESVYASDAYMEQTQPFINYVSR